MADIRKIKPENTKERINRAGNSIKNAQANEEDYRVIENWRSSHNKILNSWQAMLQNRCKGKEIVFAQRLKRKTTIFSKLSRQKQMMLSRMHDIAGCRLIFESIEALMEFRENLHAAKMDHTLKRSYDYIQTPKTSGYRGVHDVFEYRARTGRPKDWDGLKVEIQFRTLVQHAWATAVEVAGSITGNQSKFDQGENDQIEFFKLASEIIARSSERMYSCYPDISNSDIYERFKEINDRNGLLNKLKAIRILGSFSSTSNVAIIIYSDPGTEVEIYRFDSLPAATQKYFELEKSPQGKDIVLVRGLNQENIRKAYQNYFSDTTDFVRLIEEGLTNLPGTSSFESASNSQKLAQGA